MKQKGFVVILLGLILVLGGIIFYCAIRNISSPSLIIEWSTASELNTVGFNLYRSRAPDGEFTKINEHIIPSKGYTLTGGNYTYVDKGVITGEVYFYLLEDIDSSGNTTRHEAVQVQTRPAGWLELAGGALLVLVSGMALALLHLK